MNTKAQHIEKLSRRMALASLICIIALPLALAIVWTSNNPILMEQIIGLDIQNINQQGATSGLSLIQRVLGFLASMLPVGMLMWGLWNLKQLFSQYARLHLFNTATTTCLQRFAKALIFIAPLDILSGALISLITSFHNPAGQKALQISIGQPQLSTLFIGLVILAIARVLMVGQQLKEENEQFV
ncbi:DUF2975 domain-containing protein [Porticoccus sp. W117]|uniref:DUF2975 domain-containing protein n=1 Tax=Porticoccus sp. W117 TaxID=3054777 RepID=UPI0025971523|nr:DUF2975 domain-containing protein [Porticoccus sp. W117]MDM3872549.1 DUF2975 domain-containing protein [Porticoccus sp. W117]